MSTEVQRPLIDKLRTSVLEGLPELNHVKDGNLRTKAVEAWVIALAGSSFKRLPDAPGAAVRSRSSQSTPTPTPPSGGGSRPVSSAWSMVSSVEAEGRFEPATVNKWLSEYAINVPDAHEMDDSGARRMMKGN